MAHRRTTISNLPIDIVESILLEHPVKSLLRFKITCKSWCCTIDDPYFIKSHLHKLYTDISHKKFLFVNSGRQGEISQPKIRSTEALISSDSKVVCLDELKIPRFSCITFCKVFSCSGLVFIMSYNPGICMTLWNPVVRKYKLIPNSLSIQKNKPSIESRIFGFGYDFVAEDYKVLCVHSLIKNNVKDPRYIIKIYSVKNQSWRTIHNIFHVLPDSLRYVINDPVSLNGIIHRMVCKRTDLSIISFHIADEKFIVKPVPATFGKHLRLHALGDRLCVLVNFGKEISIWSLEKDGKTAWNYITKFPTLRSLHIGKHIWYSSSGVVMCVKEDGNILWRKYDGRFTEYDVRKNGYTQYRLTELARFRIIKALYVESLVSLKILWE